MASRTFTQITLLSIVFIFSLSQKSFAGLGETEDSVNRDFGRYGKTGDHPIQDKGTHRIHTVVLKNHMTLNEYVTNNGIIFGVSWSGAGVHPDLSTLLGKHYSEFQQKHKDYQDLKKSDSREKGRRIENLQMSEAQVIMGGHMRNLQGRAWVPSLIPAGMTSNDIL